MPFFFDNRQLLPTGVHDATLDEVDQCFARFQKSDRRIRLFERLRSFLKEVKSAFAAAASLLTDRS